MHLRSSARQHSSFVEHGEGLTQKARARYIAPVGRTPPVHRCCSVSQSAKGGRQFGPSRRKVVGERRRAPHRAGAFAPVWDSGVCWALWRVVRWCVSPQRTGWTQRRRHGRGCASQHRVFFRRRWPSASSNIGHSSARCMYRRNPLSASSEPPCTHARTHAHHCARGIVRSRLVARACAAPRTVPIGAQAQLQDAHREAQRLREELETAKAKLTLARERRSARFGRRSIVRFRLLARMVYMQAGGVCRDSRACECVWV